MSVGSRRLLKENNRDNGGREIIPENIYTSEYVGDIPAALEGFGEVYGNGKFEMDPYSRRGIMGPSTLRTIHLSPW